MHMQAVIGVRTLVSGLSSHRGGRGVRESRTVPGGNERGIALISVLLIMSLLLMLGLAVTFTSVSDKFITSNYKNMMSGFYAAEAGVNNLNRVLRTDEFVLASIPTPPVIVPGSPTLNRDAFIVTAESDSGMTRSGQCKSGLRSIPSDWALPPFFEIVLYIVGIVIWPAMTFSSMPSIDAPVIGGERVRML